MFCLGGLYDRFLLPPQHSTVFVSTFNCLITTQGEGPRLTHLGKAMFGVRNLRDNSVNQGGSERVTSTQFDSKDLSTDSPGCGLLGPMNNRLNTSFRKTGDSEGGGAEDTGM